MSEGIEVVVVVLVVVIVIVFVDDVCNSTIHISNAIYLMQSIIKNVSHVSDIYTASRNTGLHCSPNLLLHQ